MYTKRLAQLKSRRLFCKPSLKQSLLCAAEIAKELLCGRVVNKKASVAVNEDEGDKCPHCDSKLKIEWDGGWKYLVCDCGYARYTRTKWNTCDQEVSCVEVTCSFCGCTEVINTSEGGAISCAYCGGDSEQCIQRLRKSMKTLVTGSELLVEQRRARRAGVGARILAKHGDKLRIFNLVSPGNADFATDCVASDSIVGKAMLGSKEGDKIPIPLVYMGRNQEGYAEWEIVEIT